MSLPPHKKDCLILDHNGVRYHKLFNLIGYNTWATLLSSVITDIRALKEHVPCSGKVLDICAPGTYQLNWKDGEGASILTRTWFTLTTTPGMEQ